MDNERVPIEFERSLGGGYDGITPSRYEIRARDGLTPLSLNKTQFNIIRRGQLDLCLVPVEYEQ